ncbi:hypothetical protein C7974DRAFT_402577 [Boeremia exigua]|uniref:uncharacterized protein n=1 Tax=Boeremia exigua TaxID=749465 RepID=UPI001E8DE4EB|nr:uncharacterized protein C7974DRAFT_402577 [Boeremia exigua]KAH6616872.1 hypothetical protein C7974DRAFT_402577 [Boeremia exigua]
MLAPRPTFTSLLTLLTLTHPSTAAFSLYQIGLGASGIGANTEGFQVYPDEANCDNALDWLWRKSSDVSGGKYGVRCEGSGCWRGETGEITSVEFNFLGDFHWTWYADRDNALIDLEDRVVGSCDVVIGPHFGCGLDPIGQVVGERKLKCEVDVTADQINGNRPT